MECVHGNFRFYGSDFKDISLLYKMSCFLVAIALLDGWKLSILQVNAKTWGSRVAHNNSLDTQSNGVLFRYEIIWSILWIGFFSS